MDFMMSGAIEKNGGIDIIIPVYNALDDLKKCVESILRHTDLLVNCLILIDDMSTDPEVYPYMQSIGQEGIVILQNQQNLGFSGTINRGLQYSDRDVILLNSDTIVTEGWVEKLTACAYSDSSIGTVTPFSNNATLCSIPDFCQENVVPYGLTIDEYAGIIEKCSMRKYPRITVAVGFCMFIKREVIRQTGLFDQATFQRGYGEENDFCWRAEQLGYHHVLCDDTYIYHSGSSSFLSDEKKKLIAEHEAILQKRYPKQIQKNAEYVRDNPHRYLRSNVDIYAKLANGKKNILYVLHQDFRADAGNNIGGTQFHVKDLVTHGRQENNIFVLARDGEILRLTIYLKYEQLSFAFHIGSKPDFQPFHSAEIEKVLRQVLAAFAIDFVHVHHVSELSFDIFRLAKEMGIPLVLTLHDYYFICPTVKLLENGTAYCAAGGADCLQCLQKELGYTQQVSYLPVWREHCRQALALCDVLITPSEAAKELYVSVYPESEERIRVMSHGMDAFEMEEWEFLEGASSGFTWAIEQAFEKDYTISGWAIQGEQDSRSNEVLIRLEDSEGRRGEYRGLSVNRPDLAASRSNDKYLCSGFTVQIPDAWFASGKLKLQLVVHNNGAEFHSEVMLLKGYTRREKKNRRVAFLGGLNEAKGSRIAYHLIKQGGSRYDWYVIGGIGDPNLLTLEKSNVYKTGWYKRENIGAILRQNQIDLVCILPIWPETFCYTVSEAQLAHIPILGTDIGALSHRIRQDKTGWLVSPDASAGDILKTIDGIFADQDQFGQVCRQVESFRHKTIREMYEEYAELYRKLPAPKGQPASWDPQTIYNAYVLGQADAAGYGAATDVDLIRRVNELEATLRTINMSLEYRMVKFFNRENMPFKRQIKWMIGFAYRVYVKFFKK